MDLDDALEYIDDSELVEITPKSIRIRKIVSADFLLFKDPTEVGSFLDII
ncbi:hypothetical protein ES705_00067 [subsurface metagenome]